MLSLSQIISDTWVQLNLDSPVEAGTQKFLLFQSGLWALRGKWKWVKKQRKMESSVTAWKDWTCWYPQLKHTLRYMSKWLYCSWIQLLFLNSNKTPKYMFSSPQYRLSSTVLFPNESHCLINNKVDAVYIPAIFKFSFYFVSSQHSLALKKISNQAQSVSGECFL